MRWIGLVRNVMLGREGLDRNTLLDLCHSAGGDDPISHLTTGNLTFEADPSQIDLVVERLEAGVCNVLGRTELVAVRSLSWAKELLDSAPFSRYDDVTLELEIGFLRHDAPPLTTSPERTGRTVVVATRDREMLTARPSSGPSRPHVNRLLEQATGLTSTARGIGTIAKITARG